MMADSIVTLKEICSTFSIGMFEILRQARTDQVIQKVTSSVMKRTTMNNQPSVFVVKEEYHANGKVSAAMTQ